MNPLLTTLLFTFFLSLIGVTIRAAIPRSYATDVVALLVAFAGCTVGVIYSQQLGIPDAGIMIGSALAAIAVDQYGRYRQRRMLKLKETASALQGFALRFFDQLDADKDGLITLGDMDDYHEARGINPDPIQAELLFIFESNIGLIGHPIGSNAVVSGVGGAYVYTLYGVSRNDLLSWPERAAADYDKEFPSKSAAKAS